MYFFRFIHFIFFKAFCILRERRREALRAKKALSLLEDQIGGKLDEATRKKIVVSHSIYNPMIVDSFSTIHGRISNADERERLILYFICSSLLDNFFDRNELSREAIEAISFDTENYRAATFDERLFAHCHLTLLNTVYNKSRYLAVARAELDAQFESLQQFDAGISCEELIRIMEKKGGNAVLLCRFYLDLPWNEDEAACWYLIGEIIQLTNDLFDIYKDLNDGVYTAANKCLSADEMRDFVLAKIESLKSKLSQLPISKRKTRRLNLSLAGIYAFPLIAVENLKRLEVKYDGLHFKKMSRKDLIIDMEKPRNIFRWFMYAYRFGKI